MKRIFFHMLALVVGVILSNNLAGQNPNWTMPGWYFEPGETDYFPLPQSPPWGYTGQTSSYVHFGMKNTHEDFAFFVVDGEVYDKDGNFIDDIRIGSQTMRGGSQLLAMNMPGSCTEFMILTTGRLGSLNDEHPVVAFLNTDGLSDNPQPFLAENASFNTATQLHGNILEDYGDVAGPLAPGITGVHMAATKRKEDGTRWVFIANGANIYRLALTCDGLAYDNWKLAIPGILREGPRSELEIYEDTTGAPIRVAVPYYQPSASGNSWIRTFELEYYTGNLIPNSIHDFSIGSASANQGEPFLHGIEFSPDGSKLYFTHDPSSSLPNPLSYFDWDAKTVHDMPGLTGIGGFQNSQIQSYSNALYLTSDNYVGILNDPNSSSPSFNPTAQIVNNYPVNYGFQQLNPIPNKAKLHIVPTQIDFEDYDEMFLENCECCEKYSRYDVFDKPANEVVYGTHTWDGELNPLWSGDTGFEADTIHVRDSLIFEAGSNVSLENLTFLFAPDAKMVLKRGDGTKAGAVVTLKNTTLTLDQRCRDKYIICSDPLDSCEAKLWQGVIVEGYHDKDQTLFGSQQAQLRVWSESKIEHARTAVRLGHPEFNGWGGGLLLARESTFKDNRTDVTFDPYERFSAQGTELYNLSYLRKSDFVTTEDFITAGGILPGNRVEVFNSTGLYIQGCHFENQTDDFFSTYSERGNGVYASNSRVKITWYCDNGFLQGCTDGTPIRSYFSSLTAGVIGIANIGNTRKLHVGYSEFDINYTGVSITGYHNPDVLNNDFILPRIGFAVGVTTLWSDGYAIENNSFRFQDKGGTYPRCYGVRIINSGEGNNEVYKNEFEDITIGIMAQGINGDNQLNDDGLRMLCNRFTSPISLSDIFVASGHISDEQGICSTIGDPAGNIFSESHLSGFPSNHGFRLNTDTANITPGLQVQYRHHVIPPDFLEPRITPTSGAHLIENDECDDRVWDPTQQCLTKKFDLPSVKQKSGEASADDDSTAQNMHGIPAWTYEEILEMAYAYADTLASLEEEYEELNAANALDDSSDAIAVKIARKKHGQFWRSVVDIYQTDTTDVLPPALFADLLDTYAPAAIGPFINDINAATSGELYVVATEGFLDDEEMSEVSSTLPLEVPELFENGFMDDYENVMALNDLYIQAGRHFMHHTGDFDITEEDMDKSSEGDDHSPVDGAIGVYPNPFKEQIIFDFTAEAMDGEVVRIEIYDVTGRMHYATTFGSSPSTIAVPGQQLPEGLLIYRISVNDNPRQEGKVIHLK